MGLFEQDAERDQVARAALWDAICNAISALSPRCRVRHGKSSGKEPHLLPIKPPSEVENWKLFEALSLLMVLKGADAILYQHVVELFGRNKKIEIVEKGIHRYVWTQTPVKGKSSFLDCVPDIIATDIQEAPTPEGIRWLIECKSGERIGAPMIRAEFGKSFDINPGSYLIWSYRNPPPSVVQGAKNLGIDLVGVGFDTPKRSEFLKTPQGLPKYVLSIQKKSQRENNFARAIAKTGADTSQKFLLPK